MPGGAFEIENIPIVTGLGEVQVVARDLLGRETIYTQDFYASEELLKPGLMAYSFSLGRLREDFTMRSSRYGESLMAPTLRRGINDKTTIGGRVSFENARSRLLGLSLARTFGRGGIMSAAVARSSTRRQGTLWLIGHQYQGRRFHGDFRLQGTTDTFAQPGIDARFVFPKRQLAISAGVGLGGNGSVGGALIRERAHGAAAGRRIRSVSYSRSFGFGLTLSVAASRVETDTKRTEFGVTVSRSLGPRASTSFSLSRRSDGRRMRIDHRYELPSGRASVTGRACSRVPRPSTRPSSRPTAVVVLVIGLIAFGSDASAQLNCQITVTPLAFGAYMPGDTVSLDSTGRLDMSCRGQGCLIQISMSPGHRAAS